MVDNKFNASFQVVDKLNGERLSDRVAGVFHLFEQEYPGALSFWYGVAEAAIPWNAFARHAPNESWVDRVNVYLEDGRAGQCHILGVSAQGGADGDYMRIQLTGLSALRVLDPDDPHFSPLFGS